MPKPRLTDQQAEQLAEQKQRAWQETTGCAACDKEQERTGNNTAMCKECNIGFLEHEVYEAIRRLVEAKNDNSRT